MTLLNSISVVVFVVLLVLVVGIFVYLRRVTRDAEGFCSINERGEIGTSDEGDIVGEA